MIETSAEFRLFCLALRRPQEEADRAALRAAIAAAPRWDAILRGARRHAVAPLLLAGLSASAAPMPRPVVDALRREAVRAAQQGLAQAAALAQLIGRFTAAEVPVLVLKGVPLSLQLYGELALRSARDIDLLVDTTQVDAAEALLAQTHQLVGVAFVGRRRALYRRWFKEVEYTNAVHGRVELHYRLTDLPELLPWDFSAMWDAREEVEVSGVTVPVLGRRHLACYLCAHGAEHAWQRLRWLTDLAALLREPKEVDAALATAEEAGLATAMLHATTLAHGWLGLPLADAILAQARADRDVARLNRLLAHSYRGERWSVMPPRGSLKAMLRRSLWQRLFRLCIKPAWRYRVQLMRRDLLSPADWVAVPLPDCLLWLYPLIRPFGWLLRREPDRRRAVD
jgi:hypothetical protein